MTTKKANTKTTKPSLYDTIMSQVKENESVGTKPVTGIKVASENTRNYYTKVCGQKNINPIKGYDQLDQTTLSTEIKRVQILPNFVSATLSQVNKLQELFSSLKMPEPKTGLATLSINDASDMIGKLKTIFEKKYGDIPTPKQLEFIAKMLICPTVNKSDLAGTPVELLNKRDTVQADIITHNGMVTEIFSQKQKAIIAIESGTVIELDKANKKVKSKIKRLETKYVKLTAEISEYESNLDIEKITKQEASDFIGKYNPAYRAWFKDRASEDQQNLINTLLKRNGDPELTHEQLMQFDRNLATKFLNTLQAEIGRGKKATPIEEEYSDNSRLPKTLNEAEEAYQEVLTNVIYTLCASMGDTAEDNPILTTSNFQKEFEDLLIMVNVYVNIDDIISMIAPVLPEEDVCKIFGVAYPRTK